jgi:hypothetical protein
MLAPNGGCAHGALGCAGFGLGSGLLTCAQLPPIRLVARSVAYDTESLLANASETLGSATTMLNNFAALLDTSHRKTALGIAQVVMLGELAVNQALDKVVPAE